MAATVDGGERRVWFTDPFEHLAAELRLLDRVIAGEVASVRKACAGAAAGQGLYISDDEIDQLLAPGPELHAVDRSTFDEAGGDLRASIDDAVALAREHGVALPLPELAAKLGLAPLETQALMVCLAPELDRKYDRLYAYLQDDITRKRPSVDLVCRLTAGSDQERWAALRVFSAHAPLRRSGLVRVFVDQYSPSGSTALSQLLQVAPRTVAHFLGDEQLDEVLVGIGRRVAPIPGRCLVDPDGALEEHLVGVVRRHPPDLAGGLVVHLRAPYGGGGPELAHAVAARSGTGLVELDMVAAPEPGKELDEVLEAVVREGWLGGAAVLVLDADRLLGGQEQCGQAERCRTVLTRVLARFPTTVFLSGEQAWPDWHGWRAAVHEVELPSADTGVRQSAWADAWSSAGFSPEPVWLRELPARFRLTPGSIQDVVADVTRRIPPSPDSAPPTMTEWHAGCRRLSSRGLAGLAQKVDSGRSWQDLVLADRHRQQLHEMCEQVRHREVVLGEWGLGGGGVAANGLSALFTGPPGTGKTMAAGVIANELQLDLYRIDLSQVVSKYIGETEKNLSRIFGEAEKSNAVLLFDEADALFGKRTQVSDAHDRYANIETSYLLQRMEEYEGIAILASNLRQNMDEAFLRRLRFLVEFPFPDVDERLQIWERHLRGSVPIEEGLDLVLLARRLPVSGGSIRNIVLSAAFLAAGQGRGVDMDHVLTAARREFEKIGKLWPDHEFEPRTARSGGPS
jgi:hypothetical protein